jgi:hypothetical protein
MSVVLLSDRWELVIDGELGGTPIASDVEDVISRPHGDDGRWLCPCSMSWIFSLEVRRDRWQASMTRLDAKEAAARSITRTRLSEEEVSDREPDVDTDGSRRIPPARPHLGTRPGARWSVIRPAHGRGSWSGQRRHPEGQPGMPARFKTSAPERVQRS